MALPEATFSATLFSWLTHSEFKSDHSLFVIHLHIFEQALEHFRHHAPCFPLRKSAGFCDAAASTSFQPLFIMDITPRRRNELPTQASSPSDAMKSTMFIWRTPSRSCRRGSSVKRSCSRWYSFKQIASFAKNNKRDDKWQLRNQNYRFWEKLVR